MSSETPLCSPNEDPDLLWGFYLLLKLTRTHQDPRRLKHGRAFFSRFKHFIPLFAARTHRRLCLLSEYLKEPRKRPSGFRPSTQ